MKDMWDIAKYVEAHPDDHKERWLLAKKLYEAKEYRLALEHLQILKNEWNPKVNVARYLAATLFRMQRYGDAVRELREALESWPDEIALLEQLAKAFEMSGQHEDAANVWDEIAERMPRHPVAASVAARLRARLGISEVEKQLPGRDTALMSASNVPCPKCGARNNDLFERCWQCGAALAAEEDVLRPVALKSPVQAASRPVAWLVIGGLAVVALLAVNVFFTLMYLSGAGRGGITTVGTVYDLVATKLLFARTLAATALLATWPLSIWVGLNQARAERMGKAEITVVGLFLAALSSALWWLPLPLLSFTPLVSAAAALVLPPLVFRLRYGKALLVWLVQGAVAAFAVAVPFLAIEGTAVFREWPAMVQYAAAHDTKDTAGVFDFPAAVSPASFVVHWESTGSPWLDKKGDQVEFIVRSNVAGASLILELKSGSETVVYQYLESYPARVAAHIQTNKDYNLVVRGQEGVEVGVTVTGVLNPTVTPP